MTPTGGESDFGALAAEIAIVAVAALAPPLFLIGLGYRLWRWVTTPDEQTAKKRALRREQLKRVPRRLAREVPVHDDRHDGGEDSDPAINEEGGLDV